MIENKITIEILLNKLIKLMTFSLHHHGINKADCTLNTD